MPSLEPTAKRVKTRFAHPPIDSFNDDASSEPSQIELSGTSPNYMKSTSCSDAKKESSQASFHNSESSFDRNNPIEKESYSWKPNIVSFGYVKPVGTSRRVVSLKSSRPLKKKSSRIAPFPHFAGYVMPHQDGNESDGSTSSASSSPSKDSRMRGGAKLRKTLKKSRSSRIRNLGSLKPTSRGVKSRFDQPLSSLSSDAATPLIKVADASPSYLKETSCSEGKKMHFQASLHDSESNFGSIDESRRNSHNPKSKSGSSSLKFMQTLRRTSSLRILIKKSSFKSKRTLVKKCSQVSQDLSVNRATCSSTLKDSKFPPHHVELHPGERASERISATKVCPYTYCYLHGHHHSSTPPLKRVLSKRRRLLKAQKSLRLRSDQSSLGTKYPDDIMKELEASQMVINASTAIFPVEKEEGSDLSAQIHPKSGMEFFRRSSEGNKDANLTEVLFVETSYPEKKGVPQNLNQETNFSVAEQDILETLSKQEETKIEYCGLETSSSLLPSKLGDSIASSEPSKLGKTSGEPSKLGNADLTGTAGEPSKLGKTSTPDDMREATEDNSATSSASSFHTLEEPNAARDENNEDLATDHEAIGHFAPVGYSEPDSTAREECKSQLHKKKHFSMWHLIHQNMVSGLVAGARTQLLEGADQEKQVDDTNRLPVPKASGCSPGFTGSYQKMGIDDHDTDNQDIELHKMYAIKMVREAIEKILLPEVQDQPSDNQSISSDITSEQEIVENNHGEGDKINISNLTADIISGAEQEATASKEGKKPEKKTPKSWSNLKKLILLKRFIKELEKVRKFNPQKPQHPPLEPDSEEKKICLRHQMIDKKKSSEEWMLDYALQQVVSELAPTQKKKVELLIKAFETVVPPSDEQQIQVTFPKLKGIRQENCSTESELDNYASEATYRDTKVGDRVTSDHDNGDKNSIITQKQSNVPVDGKSERELHEDKISKFNSELLKDNSASSGQTVEVDGLSGVTGQSFYIIKSQTVGGQGESTVTDNIAFSASDNGKYGDSDSWEQLTTMYNTSSLTDDCEKLEIDNLTGATDGPHSVKKRTTSDDLTEAAADNTLISSAHVCSPLEELTAVREQKNGDSEIDTESMEGFGQVRDSEPDSSGREKSETKFDKEKHVSMWHLIHQHMVAGLAVEGKTKQLDKDKEEHIGDTNTLATTESSGSCPGFCASFQNTGMEYNRTENQEVELRKIYAIKLVREAIDKILLPEVQDQSSDDQSITSEIMSDQELIEKNCDEGGEPSISTTTDSSKESSMECDSNKVRGDISLSQEGTRLATAKISESEVDEKTASKVQIKNKSDNQIPKGWSNLKKLILLKRFIKELEKVRTFNPRKPWHLPLKPAPEAEEIHLRHQMMDERKSAEEWMLDYALRKVVSELTPKQKRKVALLIEAFETVVLPSEEPQIQVIFPKLKGTTHEGCCNESEQDKFVSKATEAGIKVMDIVTSNLDNGDNNSTITDKLSDVAVDEEAQKEVHDIVSSVRLEVLKDGSESTATNMKLDGLSSVNVEPSYVTKIAAPDGSRESTATFSIASSPSYCDTLEKLTATKEKKNGESETDCTDKVEYKTQLDKQHYMRMWHLLCQHVVSGIAKKVETQLLGVEEEDQQVDVSKILPQIRTDSCHDYSGADFDGGTEDHDSSSQKIGFSQGDAVKLVQEAIEEILLPEIQDDLSDAQSIASDLILEQELSEENHGNVGEPIILASIDSPKDSFGEYKSEMEGQNIIDQDEKGSAAHNIAVPDEKRAESMVGNKFGQQKPKNWNKLKKLILLKRSIKALEKARKSNLRAPRNLPLDPGPEEEKVDLKHQLKDERKKAEQWMLDYALQHIVTKLTPARKRRVSMLVEAFEAIVPLPEI